MKFLKKGETTKKREKRDEFLKIFHSSRRSFSSSDRFEDLKSDCED